MTHEERELLEITDRRLLKLEHGIRVAGIEAILEALFRHLGYTDMALARLTVQCAYSDPSAFLTRRRWLRSGNVASPKPTYGLPNSRPKQTGNPGRS
jgi:hypothetical protein